MARHADKVAFDIVLDTVAACRLGLVTLAASRSGIWTQIPPFKPWLGIWLLTLTFRDLQVAQPARLFGCDLRVLDVARGMARVCPSLFACWLMGSGRSRGAHGGRFSRAGHDWCPQLVRDTLRGVALVFVRIRSYLFVSEHCPNDAELHVTT